MLPAKSTYSNELLAGLTVAFALVPEALAFSVIAGLSPVTGLLSAFVIGLVTSVLGTRAGMISGATGAVAVILAPVTRGHGVEYVFATVIGAGLLQLVAGLAGLGRYTRLLTPPVITGFMNGLAIIIFLSQIAQFKYFDHDDVVHWLPPAQLLLTLGVSVAAIAIIVLVPRLTKRIPSALVAIVLLTCIAAIARLPLRSIGDIAVLHTTLPGFHIPRIIGGWPGLSVVLPYSAAMAAVGSIESLLTLLMLDRLQNKLSSPRKELLVQGFANLCSGFLSGMGGCAMTGQTRLNLDSGGTTRVSGLTASLLLLIFVLFAAPLVQRIPLAALSGVMFMIAFNTFRWDSLRPDPSQPVRDTMIMAGVTLISVVSENLALGVIAGVAASAVACGNNRSTLKK